MKLHGDLRGGVCVYFPPQDIPLIFLTDQDFPEPAKPLQTLPNIACFSSSLYFFPHKNLGQKRGLFAVLFFFFSFYDCPFFPSVGFVLCTHERPQSGSQASIRVWAKQLIR